MQDDQMLQAMDMQQPLTNEQFIKMYWFTGEQRVTVINPTNKDFVFMHNQRHYVVRAESQEELMGPMANQYLDQMGRLLAQQQDMLGHWGDVNLRRQYLDQLIAKIEDMNPPAINMTPWRREIPAQPMRVTADEPAPWEEGHGERAADVRRAGMAMPPVMQVAARPQIPVRPVNIPSASGFVEPTAPPMAPPTLAAAPPMPPQTPPVAPTAPAAPLEPETPKAAESQDREFAYDGSTYRLVHNKSGGKMHYKDGGLISAAAYNQAASML